MQNMDDISFSSGRQSRKRSGYSVWGDTLVSVQVKLLGILIGHVDAIRGHPSVP